MRRAIHILLTIIVTGGTSLVFGQKYLSDSSQVRFYSEAPLENIEAVCHKGRSAIDLATGEIACTIPIKAFNFKKKLMQEHFNENYMESDRFPNATFSGSFTTDNSDSLGWHQAIATGTIQIHGIKKEIEVAGYLLQAGEALTVKATFFVKPQDFDISIPKIVFYHIAESVEVNLYFSYEKVP